MVSWDPSKKAVVSPCIDWGACCPPDETEVLGHSGKKNLKKILVHNAIFKERSLQWVLSEAKGSPHW